MAEEIPAPSTYGSMLAALRSRREQLMAELQKIDAALPALQSLAGDDVTATPTEVITSAPASEFSVRVGEFHGLTFTAAARVVLGKAKEPLKTDELVKWIERSGRKFDSRTPIQNLYSSLKRNPEFTLVAPNTWGLSEWYPGAKRRKPLAARALEIMENRTMSINDAVQEAEHQLAGEEDEPKLKGAGKG